jgi:DNA-binding FadR family transcriptional regulator
MPLRTVETVRLYRRIAGQIAALIDSGEFPPGSKLPPERAIAAQLGVSRTSVREAVISLEIAGRVEVRVGSGIIVLEPAATQETTAAAARDRGAGPFELLQARALIEGEICAVAAPQMTEVDFKRLGGLVAMMRKYAEQPLVRDAADRAFHLAIAESTGNSALTQTVEDLWDQRAGDLWAKIEQHFHTPVMRRKTLADHEAILAALIARDADGARVAMRRHLGRVIEEFQRRIERPRADAPAGTAPRRRSVKTPPAALP